jgi:5-methylthioadenosine/S-adenosylhomocysteine deaminase
MVYAGTTLAAAEMLLSGTTTLLRQLLLQQIRRPGRRGRGHARLIAQGFIDFPTPDSPDPSRQIEIAEHFVEPGGTARPWLSLPSSATRAQYLLDRTMTTIKEAAADRRPLPDPLSETREEVDIIRKRLRKITSATWIPSASSTKRPSPSTATGSKRRADLMADGA